MPMTFDVNEGNYWFNKMMTYLGRSLGGLELLCGGLLGDGVGLGLCLRHFVCFVKGLC